MKHTHETITETGIKRAVEQMIEATASRCNIIDFANRAHFQLNAMGASEETECAAVKFMRDSLLMAYAAKYGHSYYERNNSRLGKVIEIHVSENPLDM